MSTRIYFARGSRGSPVRRLQHGLAAAGFYTGVIDGLYGGGTARSVGGFQSSKGLPVTGAVDATTWVSATASPIPLVRERALAVTAAFEGHGFGMVAGNFDGAWLTWGIIGFTLKHGELQALILDIWGRAPATVRAAFGNATEQLIGLMQRNRPNELLAWSNAISIGPKKYSVIEPWRSGFQALGNDSLMQQLQMDRAYVRYFEPSLATAAAFSLNTEMGIALAFDIHVQNGSVKPQAAQAVRAALGADLRKVPEAQIRVALANAVANSALAQYREDVRSRKLLLATGRGVVHGEPFDLSAWGLAPVLAPVASRSAVEARARPQLEPMPRTRKRRAPALSQDPYLARKKAERRVNQ